MYSIQFIHPLKEICVVSNCGQLRIELWQTSVYGLLCRSTFSPLKAITRNGIWGSHSNFMLNFIRNYQTTSQGGCTILHFPPIAMCRILVAPHPHQHLVLSGILNLAAQKCSCISLIICISLIANDVKLFFFMCLFATHFISLVKCPSMSLADF